MRNLNPYNYIKLIAGNVISSRSPPANDNNTSVTQYVVDGDKEIENRSLFSERRNYFIQLDKS